MRKSLRLIFVLLLLLLLQGGIRPVSARVFESNPSSTSLPAATDNSVHVIIDKLGNQFYWYMYESPQLLVKVSPSNGVEWSVDVPSEVTPAVMGIPDNIGGYYFLYGMNSINVVHYSSTGSSSTLGVPILTTTLGRVNIDGVADGSGNLHVIYKETHPGDKNNKYLSYKIATVGTSGSLVSTPVVVSINPTESRWCTNRGGPIEIPYDIQYGNSREWSACWSWCQSEFSSNPGTCQYNADGPRNCWVHPFPAGGVGNCVWESFVPGSPPFSGYYGMTLPEADTVPVTLETSSGILVGLSSTKSRTASNDNVSLMLRRTEGYPITDTSTFLQRIDSGGTPLSPGLGTNVTSAIAGKEVILIDDGFFTAATVDTNSDSRPDTIRVQKYNNSGASQFGGAGIDVFTYIEPNTEISFLATQKGNGAVFAIEVWNDNVPVSGNAAKIFVQAINSAGTLLYGADGTQIATYTDDPEPEYIWDVYSGADGSAFAVITTVSDTASYRIFWLTPDNKVSHAATNSLAIGKGETVGIDCSSSSSGNTICTARNSVSNHEVYTFLSAYQISTAGALQVRNSQGNSIKLGSDYGIGPAFAGYQDTITGRNVSNLPIFQVSATVSSDRDWTTVTADTDATAKKSFAHNLATAPGAASSYELLIPRTTGDNGVIVCPDVSSLSGVTENCTNGVRFGNNESRSVTFAGGASTVVSSQVTIESQLYWKLSGLKGSGGMSVTDAPSEPPTVTPPDSDTPTVSPSDLDTPTVTGDDDDDDLTPTPTDTIIVVTLPPVTVGDTSGPPAIVCPSFTSFTVSSTLVEPGTEITFAWKTKNATSVIWYGEESGMEVTGTRTFVPTSTTKIRLHADNGKCSAKVEKTVNVVGTEPWKNSAVVGVGALAVEAAVIQVAALYQAGAAAAQQAGGGLQGNILLALAGFLERRRKKKWGFVYDSVTKKPIARAVVRLIEQATGKVIDTAVSDAKGILRLSASPGTYVVQVVHPAYKFPSELVKLPSDGGYANVYRGEPLTIKETQTTLLVSIPLDPLELTPAMKRKVQGMSFIENAGNYGSLTILTVGMIYSSYAALMYPHAFNYLAVGVYSVLLLSKAALVFIKPKVAGTVRTSNGKLVSGVEIGLFDAEFKTLVYRTFTNAKGQYTFFVNNGIYLLKIMDERYSILRYGRKVGEILMLPKEEAESVRYIAEDLTLEVVKPLPVQ